MRRDIAGGQTVTIAFDDKGRTVAGEDDSILGLTAVLELDPKTKKKVDYFFSFEEKNGKVPKRVTIEDVSDDKPVVLVRDDHPKLVRDLNDPKDPRTFWGKRTDLVDPTQAAIPWLSEIDNSLRVYRFTVEQTDGTTDVILQAAHYPALVKRYMRLTLGLETLPKPS